MQVQFGTLTTQPALSASKKSIVAEGETPLAYLTRYEATTDGRFLYVGFTGTADEGQGRARLPLNPPGWMARLRGQINQWLNGENKSKPAIEYWIPKDEKADVDHPRLTAGIMPDVRAIKAYYDTLPKDALKRTPAPLPSEKPAGGVKIDTVTWINLTSLLR